MSSRPIIGILSNPQFNPEDERHRGEIKVYWNYAEAIENAGGSVIILPPQVEASGVVPLLDGLMITGGDDIPAKYWGEENHPSVSPVREERFALEQKVLEAVVQFAPNLPYLGICYGCQRLNVFRGGSLIQHLPEVVHHEKHSGGTLQTYTVVSGTKLMDIGGVTLSGESWHHQAIRELGLNLSVSAHADDGTIEAVEDPTHPFLIGLQWHPERTLDSPDSQRIFAAFVRAAKEYKEQK